MANTGGLSPICFYDPRKGYGAGVKNPFSIKLGWAIKLDMAANIIDETVVYSGWTVLRRIALQMPGGAIVERHIESHGNAAAVLPYDPIRRTAILVSMPRAPVLEAEDADLLEAIAGALDGEAPEACCRREALEEAGVQLGSLERVVQIWAMPTLSSERVTLFLAPYRAADRVGAGGGVDGEHESITVHELRLEALSRAAAEGRLQDAKTLCLVLALQLRHPELFQNVSAAPRCG